MSNIILSLINDFLSLRLDVRAMNFVRTSQQEVNNGVPDARFTALISLSSRHIPRQLLAPSSAECASAQKVRAGWDPQAWNLLEAARVSLVLSHPDLLNDDFSERFSKWFTYADEGELCAYYRAIPLLPNPQRFVWRAAEGCRTNMKSVFMAVTCDSPFPSQYFDDIAWNQLVVKALFTETPLYRVYGLDARLSTTLAHMVLDYMDERSSAGRDIPLDAWLCLGLYSDVRVDNAIQIALKSSSLKNRCAAIFALGRAKRNDRLQQLLNDNTDSRLNAAIQQALQGRVDQYAFHTLISEVEG